MKTKYCRECGVSIETNSINRTTRGRSLCMSCIYGRTRRNVGDIAFEVETCVDLPLVEGTTDADINRARYERSYHKTFDDAYARARRVYPEDKFGAVTISTVQWLDQHHDTDCAGIEYGWEVVADPIEYSGETSLPTAWNG